MERLKSSQETLAQNYAAYNAVASKMLPELELDNESALKKLLDTVMNRESIAHTKKIKVPKEGGELRSSIADVLLLLDNCDIKEIKAKMKRDTEEATEAE